MKKLLAVLLCLVLSGLPLSLQSCSDDNPSGPGANEIVIPESTVPVDTSDYTSGLVSVSGDTSTFIFASGFTAKYKPQVNDVLVIPKGEGLLRKITSIDSSGSNVAITTVQATLEDAIEQGDIILKQNLQEVQIDKVDYYYDGISYKLNKGENSNFDFNLDILLYDLDGNPNTTNDQVKLTGSFTLDASVIFEARISSFKLKNAKIGLEATNSESLALNANLQYSIQKEITLATINFSPIYFQLGPLPVVITIKLKLKAGGSGYANAGLTVGFENTATYAAGISYVRGQGWNSYSDFNNHFDYDLPELRANAGARVYVKPEVIVGVYGVLAGYANAEAYGEILVDIINNPWWQLYAGIDFGVGARAKIWGFEIFDFERKVLELRWLLAQASGGSSAESCPGIPTVTDPRNGKVYHTVLIGGQCWLRENLDAGTRINGSVPQSNNSTIEKYCYNDDPVNCNTYGGLYQWKEAMEYVNTEGARGICPSGWHIPTAAEYRALAQFAAGDGNSLKALSQGTGSGKGTNTTGFNALLGGDMYEQGYYEGVTEYGYFWNSTEYDASRAGNMNLYSEDDYIYLGLNDSKSNGFSIRCIKD